VIFGLLAGSAIYGFGGALLALPVLAVCRAAWEFFSGASCSRSWTGGTAVPVEIEPFPRRRRPRRRPSRPAARTLSE
jgi:hypothetical protein